MRTLTHDFATRCTCWGRHSSVCISTNNPHPTSSSASFGLVSIMSRSDALTEPNSRPRLADLTSLSIAHGGIKDATYGSGVSFRDPDGLPLEFFAPPC